MLNNLFLYCSTGGQLRGEQGFRHKYATSGCRKISDWFIGHSGNDPLNHMVMQLDPTFAVEKALLYICPNYRHEKQEVLRLGFGLKHGFAGNNRTFYQS